MPATPRTEITDRLAPEAREAVLRLVGEATASDGDAPLGEHKASQLAGHGGEWSGVLAYGEADRLVGYGHLRWSPPGTDPRASAELVTAPGTDRDGVAERMLAAAEEAVARAGGGLLWVWCHRVGDPAATPPARRGYDVQRRLAFLHRPLPAAPGLRPAPGGVTLRGYTGPADDAEFLRVNNAAFAGHPENGGWTAGTFAGRRALDWFDPGDLLLAWDGDRLAGFHWTKVHGPEAAPTATSAPVGEVYVLAVDPGAQGTGLGRWLLEAGLAHLHGRGCRDVILYVDRAAEGALRLYTSSGFETVHDEVCFERRV